MCEALRGAWNRWGELICNNRWQEGGKKFYTCEGLNFLLLLLHLVLQSPSSLQYLSFPSRFPLSDNQTAFVEGRKSKSGAYTHYAALSPPLYQTASVLGSACSELVIYFLGEQLAPPIRGRRYPCTWQQSYLTHLLHLSTHTSHNGQWKERGKKDLFFQKRKSIHGAKRSDRVKVAEEIGNQV